MTSQKASLGGRKFRGIRASVSLSHEISRKMNDVPVLCQTTVLSRVHNFNDTREVSFCHDFFLYVKEQKFSRIAAEKVHLQCDTTCCSAEFSRMGLGAVCQ